MKQQAHRANPTTTALDKNQKKKEESKDNKVFSVTSNDIKTFQHPNNNITPLENA